MARIFIFVGLACLLIGVVLHFGGGRLLAWFGHLPGDIRVERPNARVYVPWVSMLLVSLLLNLVLWLWRRFG